MTRPSTLPYRPDIQGLRAIAIMLVVLAHAEISAFSGGFVGVDLFFVLSGYLITGLLVSEYESNGTIRLAEFFARRLKRLLPALLMMLSLVLLMAPVFLSNREVTEQSGSAVYAATWTSNLFFAFSNLNYFSELQARDLFLHTWSLGVEEQFYLLWPIILLLSLTLLTRQLGAGRHHKQLLLVLGLLFVSSLGSSWYWWAATQPQMSFYLMPSRIWQFSLGAGVFVWLHSRSVDSAPSRGLSRVWGIGCGVVGLVLIIGSAVLMHRNLSYPGFLGLAALAGCCTGDCCRAWKCGAGRRPCARASRVGLDWRSLVFLVFVALAGADAGLCLGHATPSYPNRGGSGAIVAAGDTELPLGGATILEGSVEQSGAGSDHFAVNSCHAGRNRRLPGLLQPGPAGRRQ